MMSVARAPVRISFGGGGTDLPAYYERHGGFVVSAAITRYCYAVAMEPRDGGIWITSADYRAWQAFPAGELPAVRDPLSLPKAAIADIASEGLLDRGVDLFLASDVAPGTGLGSSSAMAVALVHVLGGYLGQELSTRETAERACRLEIERLRMPIGRQDQYASAYGGLNAIRFTGNDVRVEPLILPGAVMTALNQHLLLFSTGQSRHSAAILGQQSRASRTDGAVTESLHAIKSLAYQMRAALENGHLDHFGRLLDQGWQWKKQLSAHVSSTSIDRWYDAARAAGALGGKIAGAGGGGHLLLYVPPQRQPAVRHALSTFGLIEVPFSFDRDGAVTVRKERQVRGEMSLPEAALAVKGRI